MLNKLNGIPGWTWIFAIMALFFGSFLIGAVITERRQSRFQMVRRASARRRQIIFRRIAATGLVVSLIMTTAGCTTKGGGNVTVENSESSGFLPTVVPEETESEGAETATEEVSQVLQTLDMKDADVRSLCDQLFGSERELNWANTSFLSRTKARIVTSGFNDALGFPLYMDHDWLNGEYYQSQLEKGKEREILDLDYLATDEAKAKQEELQDRKKMELVEFQKLSTKDTAEYCEEKVTQENWENIIFTIMLLDFFNEQEVFQAGNGGYMKEVQEFLDDIYDPESKDPAGRTGLARLAEYEEGYEPTGTYEDLEHLVPNTDALRLKAFAQQLFEQDQDGSGIVQVRTTKAFWTIEGRVDNDNFVRATKNDKPEDQYTGRFYVRNYRGKNGKILFQYGINREDMRIVIFEPAKASTKSNPTPTPDTPTPAVKGVTVIYRHRYWGPGSNSSYPFPDVTVTKYLGDDYSYTASSLSGYKFHNGFSAVRGTITPSTPDPLVFTFYYEAPSTSRRSGGGGGSSTSKTDPTNPTNPTTPVNPDPTNPDPNTPKPDGEGGKTPTASGGGPGVVPNDEGYGTNQKQENGTGETTNISEKAAGTEDGKNQQERQEETAAKNEQLAEEVKDKGGNPNSSNPNDGSHTDGGNVPDTSESLRDTDGSKSSGGHITTTTTTNNGDGTTTTVTTTEKTQDSGQTVNDGKVGRDDNPSSVQSNSRSEAAPAAQSSAPAEASRSSDNSSNQSSGSQESGSGGTDSSSSNSSANNSSSSTSGASSGGGGSSVNSSSSGGGSNSTSSSGGNDNSGSTTAEVSTSDGIVSRD